jgi:hypothetical protein
MPHFRSHRELPTLLEEAAPPQAATHQHDSVEEEIIHNNHNLMTLVFVGSVSHAPQFNDCDLLRIFHKVISREGRVRHDDQRILADLMNREENRKAWYSKAWLRPENRCVRYLQNR